MAKKQKLGLTWYNKERLINIEPRILVENTDLSYKKKDINNLFDINSKDVESDNILVHGDNLLALKALEKKFSNSVKCIYIDPPYNTGSAFEHYDDNLEHSIWLTLMKPRLELLRELLSEDGVIFIQIDDNEGAYLKVLCDEIFGRNNYINTVSVLLKNIAGASGGGEDKRLKKNIEFILIYAKNQSSLKPFNNVYKYTEIYDLVKQYEIDNKSWKYNSVLVYEGDKEYICSTEDGSGDEIKIFKRSNPIIKSINTVAQDENISVKEVYYKYGMKIFRTTMPQSSIRPRVMQKLKEIGVAEDFISIEYVPKSGRNKGELYEQFYKGDKFNLLAWLRDVMDEVDGKLYKKDLQGTFWDFVGETKNLTKEGKVEFPNGKKPEALISRVIEMGSNEGDIVLDSFLGSGTTIAVAQKMNRKWIGIEMGEQAYTHCKPRLDRIIDGKDKSGISKNNDYTRGGGYKFYELAPTLIKEDSFGQTIINPDYNAEMLASAVAKHEGYKYNPDPVNFWKQSTNDSKSYLFVTTKHITKEYLLSISSEMQDDEYLVIVCKSYDSNIQYEFKNIEIKKIPQSLLNNCEYDVDNYNLNIIHPPVYDEEEDLDD